MADEGEIRRGELPLFRVLAIKGDRRSLLQEQEAARLPRSGGINGRDQPDILLFDVLHRLFRGFPGPPKGSSEDSIRRRAAVHFIHTGELPG